MIVHEQSAHVDLGTKLDVSLPESIAHGSGRTSCLYL